MAYVQPLTLPPQPASALHSRWVEPASLQNRQVQLATSPHAYVMPQPTALAPSAYTLPSKPVVSVLPASPPVLEPQQVSVALPADIRHEKIVQLSQTLGALPAPKSERPNFTSQPINGLNFTADVTYGGRCIYDVISAAQAISPPDSGYFYDAFAAGDPTIAFAYHVPGITTGGNFAIAGLDTYFKISKWQAANKIGDENGKQVQFWDGVRTTVQTGAGLAYIAYRPLAVASAIKGVQVGVSAPSLLGRITAVVSWVGNILFSAFYFFLMMVGIIGWYQAHKYRKELEQSIDLVKLKTGDQGELLKYVQALEKKLKPAIAIDDDTARAEALKAEVENMQTVLKEIREAGGYAPEMSDDQCRQTIYSVLFQKHSEYGKANQELIDTGRRLLKEKAAAANNTDLARQTMGNDALKLWEATAQNAQLLSERLTAGETVTLEEAKKLVESVQKGLAESIRFNAIVAIPLGLLGFVGMVLSLALGGTAVLVGAILLVISTAAMFYVDYYVFKDAVKGPSQSGVHDTKFLWLSNIFSLFATITMILLCAFFSVASFGTVPAIIGIVLCVLWFAWNCHALHKIDKANEAYMKNNPTLEYFRQMLLKFEKEDDVKEIFGHFPQEIQAMIQQEFAAKTHKTAIEFFDRLELAKAAEESAKKIKATSDERLRELGNILKPLLAA